MFTGVGEYVDQPYFHSADLTVEDTVIIEDSLQSVAHIEKDHAMDDSMNHKSPAMKNSHQQQTQTRRRKILAKKLQNANSHQTNNNDRKPSFSIASNAIVVNIATPQAIADAVDFLIQNCTARYSIAVNGRATVKSYFTVERQMDQYSELYESLTSPRT